MNLNGNSPAILLLLKSASLTDARYKKRKSRDWSLIAAYRLAVAAPVMVRFIAPTGAQVVELGPINASIHKNNEHVAIADLDQLTLIYEKILEEVLL